MGAKCTGGCFKNLQSRPKLFRDTIPDDIHQYHPSFITHKLPKLSFQGTISNIRIVDCPSGHSFSLKIIIDDVIEIDLPKRRVEPASQLKVGSQMVSVHNQLKWLSRQNLSFMMDEYQLRTHFINVYIYDEEKSIQSQIRVNLYSIVTGPYRHDFYINLKGHAVRLLFEINISQKIEAKLQALEIDIQLQKSYLGEEFNFSLKQINHGQVISTSKISSSETIPFQLNSQSTSYMELNGNLQQKIHSPTLKRKKGKKNVIMLEPKSSLQWSSSSNLFRSDSIDGDIILKTVALSKQKLKRKLPHLKLHILSNQINKSIVQFNLWIENNNNIKISPLQETQKESIMFGQAQISLYKIFDEAYQVIQTKKIPQTQIQCPDFKLQVREFVRQQFLRSKDGQIIGKSYMKFRLTNPKFFKQMNYCAKTQDGIINMTTAFKNYSGKNTYPKNKVINNIVKISENIHGLAKRLSLLQATVGVERKQIIKVEDEIYNQFNQMNQELINSFDASFVFSSSHLETELLQAQSTLIQVLQQIYIFLLEENSHYTDICWQVAVNIYKRGEFYLENVGFKDFGQKNPTFNKDLQNKKVSVALRFKSVLYKYLVLVLEQDSQNKHSGTILWSQCFKAYAYFRVPIFRNQVLQVLENKEDDHLIEWQLQDFDEQSSTSQRHIAEHQKSTNYLDWKSYFYDPLESKEQSLKLDQQLSDTLQMNKWIQRLTTRESDFYYFVGYLVKILGEIGKTLKVLKWKYFTGYAKIVRSFLIEMNKASLAQFTSIMIHASTNLLVNEDLINILLPLITEKIDINHTESLTKGLNIVWNYFFSVTNQCKIMLPQIFNYLYFFKIIKLVFESESSFAIAKVLALIQKFWKCLNEEFKENIAMYMMGKVFFKLFFHWSFTIRMVFHIIFISRIYFQLIRPLDQRQTQGSKTIEYYMAKHYLEEKYFKLRHLIQSAERLKKEELNNELYNYCFKDLHKKMKKKLSFKSRGSDSTTQNLPQELDTSNQEKYLIKNLLKYEIISKQKGSFFILDSTQKAMGKSHLYQLNDPQSDQTVIKLGGSFCLERTGIDKRLYRLEVDKQKQHDSDSQNSLDEQIKRERTTTNTVSQQKIVMQKLSQNGRKADLFHSPKIHLASGKIHRKISYSYFGNSENELEQLTQTQIRQIQIAMKEFRVTESEIEKFVKDNGRAPQFDLNVQLDKDGEFEPDLLKWSFDQS